MFIDFSFFYLVHLSDYWSLNEGKYNLSSKYSPNYVWKTLRCCLIRDWHKVPDSIRQTEVNLVAKGSFLLIQTY